MYVYRSKYTVNSHSNWNKNKCGYFVSFIIGGWYMPPNMACIHADIRYCANVGGPEEVLYKFSTPCGSSKIAPLVPMQPIKTEPYRYIKEFDTLSV